MTSSALSLDEQIAQEELLIRCYQAELENLKRKQRVDHDDVDAREDTEPAVTDHNPGDNHVLLEWMMQDNVEAAQELASNADLDPARLIRENQLQATLSGFCLESVDRLASQSPQARCERYKLRGYFMDDPSLGAEIEMELQAMDPNDQARSPPPNGSSSNNRTKSFTQGDHHCLRMARLHVRFAIRRNVVAPPGQSKTQLFVDTTWLQQHVASAMMYDPLNLPHWMDRTKRYLRFLNQRRAFLERHAESITVTDQVHSKLTMEVNVAAAADDDAAADHAERSSTTATASTVTTDNNTKAIIRLCWDWSWKHEKDLLRLPERAPASLTLHRAGLTHLVKVAGSCQAAIELMLDNNNGQETRRRPQQPDAKDSDSDYKALSSEEELSYRNSGNDDDSTSSSEDEHGYRPSEYELQRLERIKRNEEYFASLGLQSMSEWAKNEGSDKRRKTE